MRLNTLKHKEQIINV